MEWHRNVIIYLADFPKYKIVQTHTPDDAEINHETKTCPRRIEYLSYSKTLE